ncbi:MAG: Spo0E like sporulation regulatory protein [Candidatus Petromonas sp.]|jgi:hypothetical protein|nr:Spo0E like sporulation regulatory protein [Candidatus Petromonas sp.]
MHKLIEKKSELVDPEIIKISQDLDELLNIYNRNKRD